MSATGCVHQLALSNKMKPVHVLAAATLLLSLSQQRLGPAAVLRLCLVGPVFLLQASVQYYFLTLAVLVSSYFAEASDLTSAALLLLAAPFFHDFKAETTFLCSLAQISLYAALQGEGEELMLLAGEVALSLFLCRLNSQLKEVKSQVTAAEEEVAHLIDLVLLTQRMADAVIAIVSRVSGIAKTKTVKPNSWRMVCLPRWIYILILPIFKMIL